MNVSVWLGSHVCSPFSLSSLRVEGVLCAFGRYVCSRPDKAGALASSLAESPVDDLRAAHSSPVPALISTSIVPPFGRASLQRGAR